MTLNPADLDKILQQAFDASTAIYKERGFQRRIGFGKRPALVSIDLANACSLLALNGGGAPQHHTACCAGDPDPCQEVRA